MELDFDELASGIALRGTAFASCPSFYAKKRSVVPEDLTIHNLRHTAASLAIASGENVTAVQRMLGHASAAMTLDVYADLFEDDLGSVSLALHKARARSI